MDEWICKDWHFCCSSIFHRLLSVFITWEGKNPENCTIERLRDKMIAREWERFFNLIRLNNLICFNWFLCEEMRREFVANEMTLSRCCCRILNPRITLCLHNLSLSRRAKKKAKRNSASRQTYVDDHQFHVTFSWEARIVMKNEINFISLFERVVKVWTE